VLFTCSLKTYLVLSTYSALSRNNVNKYLYLYLYISSHIQCDMVARSLWISCAKNLGEILRSYSQRGVGKNCNFQQISNYLGNGTSYKADTYVLRKINRKSYMMYRMVTLPMTWSKPNPLKLPLVLNFGCSFISLKYSQLQVISTAFSL